MVEGERLDVTPYTVQYELLRSQVFGSSVNGYGTADQPRGFGLALLLSEGMPGWLKGVATAFAPRAAIREEVARASEVAERLSGTQRHEITTLLASLVLSALPVAHQTSREGYRS